MDDELSKIIKIIGSVVLTAILYALPILLTCSIVFSWIPIIKIVLTIANICVFALICSAMFVEVGD